jgi:hypothetical protein
MEYLSKDQLRTFTPEELQAYQSYLQSQMAKLAVFHQQVLEVRSEK